MEIERGSRLESTYQGRTLGPSDEDNPPMREVPPPIEMASDLAPEPPAQGPHRDDSPPEHMLMLERIHPTPPYTS